MIRWKRYFFLNILFVLLLHLINACGAGQEGKMPMIAGDTEQETTGRAKAELADEVDLTAVETLQSEGAVIVGALGAERVDVLASALSTGYDIYSSQGSEIGEAEDFLLDVSTGFILFLLVDFGGYMGIGATNIPIPLHALEWRGEEQLVLRVPEEYLEGLPDMPSNWPQGQGEKWDDDIRSFWAELGIELIPEAEDVANVKRYSQLFTTATQSEESGGIIADAVVDLTHGRIKYVLLDFTEPTLRVIPWSAVEAATGQFVFDPDLDGDDLATAPRVPADLPALHTDPDWDEAIRAFWNEAGFPPDAPAQE